MSRGGHPALPAALLMGGVVVIIVLAAALSTFDW